MSHQINNAPKNVREYLKQSVVEFQQDENFEEGLSAHLEPGTQALQIEKIKSIFMEIIQLS